MRRISDSITTRSRTREVKTKDIDLEINPREYNQRGRNTKKCGCGELKKIVRRVLREGRHPKITVFESLYYNTLKESTTIVSLILKKDNTGYHNKISYYHTINQIVWN